MSGDERMLRKRGERLTRQRRQVLAIMRATQGHITAEDVLRKALAQDADVSIASVYRILGWLTDHGLICVTDTGSQDLVYEYLGSNRHHHLICQICGEETEVPFDLMDSLIGAIRDRYDFEPRIDHQAIFGTCCACRMQTPVKRVEAP